MTSHTTFDKFESGRGRPNNDVHPPSLAVYIVDRLEQHLAHLQCIPSTVNYAY
jgi:hypothetical protein